ncbi:Uncharacterized conserved protein [Deinococcus reticulitermitis]|uniref:Uncharacterized conserved protein n=1 Tax=Deinococcus reticulitermitis TaxID=856736 RepID=A0A1H7CXI1_9DEIO|nr:CRISPR system precrRNA processing endoribonuclease RAMP protein Cas6 [Deinococcus reticulitermitis]SEJ94291.1 Uncharacterized conserved protein [Deinococcus reticulitermitis]
MPALLEIELDTPHARPTGLLGVPLHGLIFSALERVNPALSTRIHEAEIKPFRIGQSRWDEGEDGPGQVRFQLGLLDDELLGYVLQALAPGSLHGDPDSTLRGEVRAARTALQESYAALYARHASGTTGRQLRFEFLTPTTFRANDLDLPFPVPKTLFYGLQRRWEAFSDLHFGPELNDWISRAVRVQDFGLRPRRAHFKGMRNAALTACVGEVEYLIARPGDAEPTFARLLADYANYSGVGYKTAYGLGHVETSGWRSPAAP